MISGQTRAVVTTPEQIGKCGGVPPTQGIAGSNRWISTSLPAALTLQLKAPGQLAQAELVFDTGMHMELDNVGKGKWGAQQQTVRDYVIEGRDSKTGQWTMLCNVSENYQRKRIHRLPCPIDPPGPAPPPAPAAIAPGALQAIACEGMSTPLQMWTIDSATGEVTTIDGKGGGKLCLGFDDKMLAFGGKGKAVVARPCGGENSTKWTLKEVSTQATTTATRFPGMSMKKSAFVFSRLMAPPLQSLSRRKHRHYVQLQLRTAQRLPASAALLAAILAALPVPTLARR